MKKLIAFALLLAMAFSMVACACDHQWQEADCTTPKTCAKCGETEGEAAGHTPGELVISAVDTDNLTVTHDLPCNVCGEIMETKTSSTGIAPVNGAIHVSPEEWYNCLLTNISNYGAAQTLYGYPVESEDNALLHSIVTMSQMNAVFSFQDVDGNTITVDDQALRGNVHNIRMDARFTNDNAKEFLMLLMLVMINNNATLDTESVNALAQQVMSGSSVTDNGYAYAMEIVSVEEHRVCVSITAE